MAIHHPLQVRTQRRKVGTMILRSCLLLLLLTLSEITRNNIIVVKAFALTTRRTISSTGNNNCRCLNNNGPLSALPPVGFSAIEFAEDVEKSRVAFYIWFFGASGAAGIARSSFPNLYNKLQYVQSLKGEGPTAGGELLGLGLGFLTGYPEDLKKADVEKIVNNKLSVEQMVNQYPVEDNFLAAAGYLTFDCFQQANAQANPLALRAVFDSLGTSDCVDPIASQDLLNAYKDDLGVFKTNFYKTKLQSFASVFMLLFLLGFADIVAAGHAYHGWFPDWPGGQNFPQCLFDKDTGPLTIPDYWLKEIP